MGGQSCWSKTEPLGLTQGQPLNGLGSSGGWGAWQCAGEDGGDLLSRQGSHQLHAPLPCTASRPDREDAGTNSGTATALIFTGGHRAPPPTVSTAPRGFEVSRYRRGD